PWHRSTSTIHAPIIFLANIVFSTTYRPSRRNTAPGGRIIGHEPQCEIPTRVEARHTSPRFMDLLDKIVSLSKRRGFIFPSSEIYGGLGATYDYGPLGVELKRNVKERWWHHMVYRHDNIEGLDAAILMHPTVWKASGHVDAFNDPMIDDRASKKRYRADQLIEGHIARLGGKGKTDEAERAHARLVEALHADDAPAALYDIIIQEEIRSPDSGAFDWTPVRQFNLM